MTPRRTSGTCSKAGTGTSRIAKPREPSPPASNSRPVAVVDRVIARIGALDADHLVIVDVTAVRNAVQTDHRALAMPNLWPRPKPKSHRLLKRVHHVVKSDLAKIDHAAATHRHHVNERNHDHLAAKNVANVDHADRIVPPPRSRTMNSDQVSTKHQSLVRPPSVLAPPPNVLDPRDQHRGNRSARPKKSMSSSAICLKKPTKSPK